jgi:hypothetical protein
MINSQQKNFDNFYTGNDYKEKTEEELINLNNSDEFKNEFLEQNKNFNNFNFTQASHNQSSACKNINNLGKNKNAFNSHLDYENEEGINIYSSIFSNNKLKKSYSTNYLGDFEHKIPYDPNLFSSDNNNLERIFHSPNIFNFNSSHSKEKNIFEEDINTNKKHSLSNSYLKKPALSSNQVINAQPQEKIIGSLKVDQNNQNIPNAEHLENLKNSNSNSKNKPINLFKDSTSAYSNKQKNIPNFTPNSEFSREMQVNNLMNDKEKFLYPNYSDFNESINIPNLSSSSKLNPIANPFLSKNLNANNLKNNKNDIIYENQNDYESEYFGMSHLEDFVNNKKDGEGENIVNNFLNDEINYTPKRRENNDESFDNRNFETFDCCNIDSFINPEMTNVPKSGFHNSTMNNQYNQNEDAILNVSEGNNFNMSKINMNNQRTSNYNPSIGLKTHTTSAGKLPLNIHDDICFIPKSIRNGVAAGTFIKNNMVENQNDNKINIFHNNGNISKNESLYNIIENFKNFTNLSEDNLKNPNRNPNVNNNFINNADFDNRNNFFSQSTKNINLQNKIEPLNKNEDNNYPNNNNQLNQQKLMNQNNMNENTEDFSSSDYPNSLSSYSQNMNLSNNFNQGISSKNINQAVNMQIGDKQHKQGNQSSQSKTGWVCSQCKNFNYESKNNFFYNFFKN